jgi:hypothetical protein
VPIIDCYTLLGPAPRAEVDLSVEALAGEMQARQVTRALVTHTAAIFYDQRLGNQQAAEVCAKHAPLTPTAVINPLDYPGCMEEIERGGGHGLFRLCPREHGYPFSASVGPLRECLAALRGAKLILVDLVGLPAPVLSPDAAELLPVPTAFSTDAAGLGTLIHAGKQSPNVWAETSHLDAGGALEAAAQHLGAERVIFGSTAPLLSMGSAVMSVQYAELSEADRTAIFEGNVQRLLG